MRIIIPAAFFTLSCITLTAQDPPQATPVSAAAPSQSSLDQQIRLMRKDIRSQRKQIVAENMNLTTDEAVKFWPVYDQYIADLAASNDTKYALIKEYLQSDNMSEEQADSIAKRWITVDENVVQLRNTYLSKFRSVLSARQTARFYQIDRRVQMLIDLQLASMIPLVDTSGG